VNSEKRVSRERSVGIRYLNIVPLSNLRYGRGCYLPSYPINKGNISICWGIIKVYENGKWKKEVSGCNSSRRPIPLHLFSKMVHRLAFDVHKNLVTNFNGNKSPLLRLLTVTSSRSILSCNQLHKTNCQDQSRHPLDRCR